MSTISASRAWHENKSDSLLRKLMSSRKQARTAVNCPKSFDFLWGGPNHLFPAATRVNSTCTTEQMSELYTSGLFPTNVSLLREAG